MHAHIDRSAARIVPIEGQHVHDLLRVRQIGDCIGEIVLVVHEFAPGVVREELQAVVVIRRVGSVMHTGDIDGIEKNSCRAELIEHFIQCPKTSRIEAGFVLADRIVSPMNQR